MIGRSNPGGSKRNGGIAGMGSIDLLRSKAEKYLEKARAVSDRQRARLLLLQAHNLLKSAEETEAQQLSARRPPSAEERERAA